jgi:hypothetical protein
MIRRALLSALVIFSLVPAAHSATISALDLLAGLDAEPVNGERRFDPATYLNSSFWMALSYNHEATGKLFCLDKRERAEIVASPEKWAEQAFRAGLEEVPDGKAKGIPAAGVILRGFEKIFPCQSV